MNFKSIKTIVLNGLTLGLLNFIATPLSAQQVDVDAFVRVRCSTDSKNVYTEWKGSMYAFVPQEKPRKLFNLLGMNVARCIKSKQGQWLLTSRELNYYLDPKSGKIVDKWQNPWTGEVVPVVHVANNPVQSTLSSVPPTVINGAYITFIADVPLTYPNVLANYPKFKDYSPEPLYQAGEFFKLTTLIKEVQNDPEQDKSSTTNIQNVHIDWTRFGPWLPWMKMKGKPGHLIYSATSRKLTSFDQLSPLLQQEINQRLPLYQEAPSCFLATDNETSWSYFGKYFAEYVKGSRFPIAAPITKDICS
jgi:Protein of unknown function (DUF1838)